MSLLSRVRITPAFVLALAAVVIALRGVAIGSVPSQDGTITGCFAKHGGKLRIIDSSAKGKAGRCRRNERKLTWNQKGPSGAQGSAGTPGTPGATNVVIRFVTFTSDSFGLSSHRDVTCNPGERAVGGGIGWTQSPGSGDAITYSGPEDADHEMLTFPNQGATPTGWAGEIKTSDGAGKPGRVYAICAAP
jgi:hypothetical protein